MEPRMVASFPFQRFTQNIQLTFVGRAVRVAPRQPTLQLEGCSSLLLYFAGRIWPARCGLMP
ncbi:MAG: hypothetical protein ACPH5V_11770, partial [Alcanivorax sp.]